MATSPRFRHPRSHPDRWGSSLAEPGTDGLVVVDKPAGPTSHDIVASCRRVFGQRRVGHAGTLDPDATGVLLVGLGRATRLLRWVTLLPKSYEGEVVIGVETSTLDAAGEVVATHEMGGLSVDAVQAAALGFVGDIDQIPPMVSAVKVGGRRLHEMARAGETVERAPRRVTVTRFEVTGEPEPGVFAVSVDCSSGTYVRTLAADLGHALGGGAHLRNLRRTAIGGFTVHDAVGLDDLAADPQAAVLAPAAAVAHLDTVMVAPEVAARVAVGAVLDQVGDGEGPWAVVDAEGRLLAVYELRPDGRCQPAVVLAG